jgi:hypothetical protein
VATGVRPTTRPKGAVPTLVGGGDRRLLHNPLLDLFSSLTIFLVFSGSSGGILPPLQLQLRPWRAIPRGRLDVPTPPARAIPITTSADSRRNVTQPGTSWRSPPNRLGSPSSSGSINTISCLRPSTVNPVTCLIST